MEDNIRAEFSVIGRVQGVGFRYFVYKYATGLGLTGYARNLYDGSVRVVAEGTPSAIKELHGYLKKGPSMSRVDSCFIEYSSFTGEFDTFDIH